MRPTTTQDRTRQAGFTLIELLIGIVMAAAVMGAAFSLFSSQNRFWDTNRQRYDMMQNARGALEEAQRVIRTMGAGVPNSQPVMVYGDNNVLAFNTDYIENDTVSTRWAAYFNAQTPASESIVWDVATAGTIPGTSYVYPPSNFLLGSGDPSPAETYIFFFSSDSSTTRSDDFILWQRVNNGTPVIVARNILAHPSGRPFFQYLMQRTLSTGDTLMIVPTANIPLKRTVVTSTTTDTASATRPDSVRAIRLSLRFTNGKSGTDERFRDIETIVRAPNNGIPMPTVCGRNPIAPTSLTVVDTAWGSGKLWFTWSRSTDQDAGEKDVLQYILYRKLQSATTWSDPLMIVRAVAAQTSYTQMISGNTPGTAYTFGVSAQDCTPNESTILPLNVTPHP
jgi:prepilin-type N-terminal cleavage/methylation domain-containing protein